MRTASIRVRVRWRRPWLTWLVVVLAVLGRPGLGLWAAGLELQGADDCWRPVVRITGEDH